jgi:hypothetical protein
MDRLIFHSSPTIEFGTNTFINVPVILQYEDTPLISVVHEQQLGYTTEVPVYHSDGTYLAKVRGTRIYPTPDGEKSGLVMRLLAHETICELNGRTVFEIQHKTGDSFRTNAELYTPDGRFLSCVGAAAVGLADNAGKPIEIFGSLVMGNLFSNCPIGVHVRRNGSISIGF